ncbi:endochitinase At2g43610-like [Nasonia vitripennis]|uniref:Glycoside hydrolase family 19 catalytic domain-containing protein n=1 Tax=Nasonia vitripennis TaxID=7425 RepID=A0A7M7J5B5_NASVI|nr:endochitinase At2g43610-like [Nasonia vitripennis]
MSKVCLEGNHCLGLYDDGNGLPNRTYYGRGFIQLTWAANYKVASECLGLGDKLLKDPDLVATDIKINMLVSVWYWKARVQPLIKGKEDSFGLTTKGINPEECVRVNRLAKRRYRIYLKVADALKIENKAKENGCYN